MLLKLNGGKPDENENGAGDPASETLVKGRGRAGPSVALLSAASGLWAILFLGYFAVTSGLQSLTYLLPHEVALFVIALVLPPIFIWQVALVLKRGEESARSRAALLEVLADVSGPDRDAESRLNAAAISLRRISQTVEAELANALARADDLNQRIETGIGNLAALSEGAGQSNTEATRMLEAAEQEHRKLLTDLHQLGERTRSLTRIETSELSSAVATAARRADEISVALDAKARAASETVAAVAKRAQEIGTAIDQPMTRMREDSELTVRRLNAASQELKTRVEALSAAMSRTTDQAGQASAGVDDSSARLRQAATDMRGVLSGTGEEVRQRVEQLEELVAGTMRASESATQRLDQRLGQFAASVDGLNVSAGEAEEALLSSVDRFGSAMERLSDQSADIREVTGETMDRADKAAASVMAAGVSFGAATRQMDSTSARLAMLQDEMTASSTHLSGVVQETVSEVEERFREVTSFAESASERSGEKLIKITRAVVEASRGLEKQIALLEDQARQTEAQGGGAADILGLRLGELKAVLAEIEEETARGNSGMSRLTASSTQALENLRDQTGQLTSAIDEGEERATGAAASVAQAMSDIRRASVETESRLNQLGEAASVRVEGLGVLGQRLAQTAITLEQQTAERLDLVARRIESISTEAAAGMGTLSEDLIALFDELRERSDLMTGAISEATSQSDAGGRKINETMAELSLLMQDVDRAVAGADESFAQLDDRVRGVAESIRGGVEDNLTLMEDRGRQVTGRLFDSANAISDASQTLEETAGTSLHRLSELRQRTVGELQEVEGRLDGLTDAWRDRVTLFEAATDSLQQASNQLDGDTASRLADFTGRLTAATDTARTVVTQLESEGQQIRRSGQEASDNIAGALSETELRMAALVAKSESAARDVADRVDDLQTRVTSLQEVSAGTALQAEADNARVREVIENVSLVSVGLTEEVGRLARTGNETVRLMELQREGLAGGAEALTEGANGLTERLSQSAGKLVEEGERISLLLSTLQADTGTADAGLLSLAQTVRDATEMAQLTSDTLLSSAEAMMAEARSAGTEAARTAEAMSEGVRQIGEIGDQTVSRIAGATDELEIRVSSLRAANAEAEEDIIARAERVAERMRELSETGAGMQKSWSASAQAMENSASSSEAQSRAAIARLQEAMGLLEETLPKSASLQAAGEALRREGRAIGDQVVELEKVGAEAMARLGGERDAFAGENRALMDTLANGLERLNANLEEARARTAAFSTAEEAALQKLATSNQGMKDILEQSEQVSASMSDRGAELDKLLRQRIEAVEEAERGASQAAELLAESLLREQDRLTGMRDLAMTDAEQFAGNIAAALDDLKTRSAEFANSVGDFNAATTTLKDDLTGSARQIANDSVAFAQTGEQVREIADRSTRQLEEQRALFAQSAEDAADAAARARKLLGEQATAIASASQAATMQSGLAAKAFEGQAGRLESAARQATESSAILEDRARQDRDKRFLISASFVTEGLNSLSLDLHRILDSDATQASLRKYLSGDRGLFARRLIGRDSRRKIAASYEQNGDFRRHVDQYLSEFESVLTAAIEADHESIMTGVFLSADVGKLYLVLCDALDRQPVRTGKGKKA